MTSMIKKVMKDITAPLLFSPDLLLRIKGK